MDWVEGTLLKEYINDNSDQLPQILPPLAENFKKMVKFFHEKNIAHGDLQHGNILVNPDGSLVVIDYDSMFIEPLKGMPDQIKGLPGYQHPRRFENQCINNKLDYFSELVIYLSLLVYAEKPQLWQHYYETEDLLFSKDDFNRKQHSRLIEELLLSKNRSIAELTHKLLEQLTKTDIQHLEPLEEASISKLLKVKELIASQWEKQPNPPQVKKPSIPNVTEITDKF
jgi:serine/threonine protein kinase